MPWTIEQLTFRRRVWTFSKKWREHDDLTQNCQGNISEFLTSLKYRHVIVRRVGDHHPMEVLSRCHPQKHETWNHLKRHVANQSHWHSCAFLSFLHLRLPAKDQTNKETSYAWNIKTTTPISMIDFPFFWMTHDDPNLQTVRAPHAAHAAVPWRLFLQLPLFFLANCMYDAVNRTNNHSFVHTLYGLFLGLPHHSQCVVIKHTVQISHHRPDRVYVSTLHGIFSMVDLAP